MSKQSQPPAIDLATLEAILYREDSIIAPEDVEPLMVVIRREAAEKARS